MNYNKKRKLKQNDWPFVTAPFYIWDPEWSNKVQGWLVRQCCGECNLSFIAVQIKRWKPPALHLLVPKPWVRSSSHNNAPSSMAVGPSPDVPCNSIREIYRFKVIWSWDMYRNAAMCQKRSLAGVWANKHYMRCLRCPRH